MYSDNGTDSILSCFNRVNVHLSAIISVNSFHVIKRTFERFAASIAPDWKPACEIKRPNDAPESCTTVLNAFYKTGPDKYLLFFKAGQADAMTACFSEYSRKVLSKAKSNRVPIREQLKQAADQLSKEKPKQKERAKEVAHEDR